ncbi:hypothetical protein ABPG77_001149 [Micractinium sp. CCAP 211/92]
MSPQAAATGTAALVLSALLALAVAQQEPVCYEPAQPSAQAKLVRFGSGELYVPPGPNGYRADTDNTFQQLQPLCKSSGGNAATQVNRWLAQLFFCGAGPCTSLPAYASVTPICGSSVSFSANFTACNLLPTGPATYNSTQSMFYASFDTTLQNAYRGSSTFYYVRCYYLCNGDRTLAGTRGGGSMTVEAPLAPPSPPAPSPPPPPAPSPPPSPPPPPPPANFFGIALATISAPGNTLQAVVWSPPGNEIRVVAQCLVHGRYAGTSLDNWPAQFRACGNPPGSDACMDMLYDSSQPVIIPTGVQHNDGQDTYTATYDFFLPSASLPDLRGGLLSVTRRIFLCLYQDSVVSMAYRADATRPSPRPPALQPPARVAAGWGDPFFRGFDNKLFQYHGAKWSWTVLLGSAPMGWRIRALFQPVPQAKGVTFMRAVEYTLGVATEVYVALTQASSGQWQMSAMVNKRPVKPFSTVTVPRTGVRVTFSPARIGLHGTVIIQTDTLRLTVIQMWRRNHGDHADFLNFSLGILRPLKRPVSGILGPSYLRAAGPGGPRGKVADAAASSTASGQPLLSATTV